MQDGSAGCICIRHAAIVQSSSMITPSSVQACNAWRLVYASLTSLLVCRLVPLPPPPASARAAQQQWHSPLLRLHPLPRVASVRWPPSLRSLWRLPLQRWVQSPWWQATGFLHHLLPACCGELHVRQARGKQHVRPHVGCGGAHPLLRWPSQASVRVIGSVLTYLQLLHAHSAAQPRLSCHESHERLTMKVMSGLQAATVADNAMS